MKLLLHICCAPCLIYPLERFKKEKTEVAGFFYNPNIHPVSEYKKRRMALVEFSANVDIEIFYPEYLPSEFLSEISHKEQKLERCPICWRLRFKKTARFAKENGFDCFSTTLLVSPYQDNELLKKIGEEIAVQEKIPFYYEDFRPGFRKAHDLARLQGIYCQQYCGCIYSDLERDKEK